MRKKVLQIPQMVVLEDNDRSPEQNLIIAFLYKCYLDATMDGDVLDNCSLTQARNNSISGRLFLFDKTEVNWGGHWLTATELCEIATSDDYYVEKLRKAFIKNRRKK